MQTIYLTAPERLNIDQVRHVARVYNIEIVDVRSFGGEMLTGGEILVGVANGHDAQRLANIFGNIA